MKEYNSPVKVNLQLFSEFFPEGGVPDIPNPILSDGDNIESQDNQQASDESNQQLDNDTQQSSQQPNQQTVAPNNDYSQIQSQLDAILNSINKPQVEAQAPYVPEVTAPTEEEIEALNNDFYLKFTERPLEALEELIEQRASQKMQPIQSYFDNMQKMNYWNNEIDTFEKQYPDFKEYLEDVSQIIESDESIRGHKNPLELAYKVAKANKMEANNIPLAEQIKDPAKLNELLGNNEIKNLIIKELKLNSSNIPTVLGSDGKTSFNVSDKPKTIEDATKAWLNS